MGSPLPDQPSIHTLAHRSGNLPRESNLCVAILSPRLFRFEFEDKKEYLNELSKQQFDLAATTHYTTDRSQVNISQLTASRNLCIIINAPAKVPVSPAIQ